MNDEGIDQADLKKKNVTISSSAHYRSRMSTTLQNPKHPKAWLYLQSNLLDGIARFADLEKIIADLPTPQEGEKGFGVRHISSIDFVAD